MARLAKDAGVDVFHLENSDDLPWLAEALGPSPATILVGTRAPAIGGRYRPDAPDRHVRFVSFSVLSELLGAMGPYRVLGGWDIGTEAPDGAPTRAEAARAALDPAISRAIGVTYTAGEQMAGLDFMRHAARAGLGLIAMDLPGIEVPYLRDLTRPARTRLQAEIQFVLANQYVACALVRPETPDQLREALGAGEAEPLTILDVERVIEGYAHRLDGCM